DVRAQDRLQLGGDLVVVRAVELRVGRHLRPARHRVDHHRIARIHREPRRHLRVEETPVDVLERRGQPVFACHGVHPRENRKTLFSPLAHALSHPAAHHPRMRTIMIDGAAKVACPKCSHHFALSEGLSRESIERHHQEFERALLDQKKALEQRLAAERKRQFDTEGKALSEALAAKEGSLSKFRDEELQLRRRLRELEESDKNRDVDYQRKLDDERRRIDAQYKVQLESAQREAADLKRKLESGAVQFQGEGLEVSLEALLRAAFPLDEIVPVPKGMNGADLLQRVCAPSGACCGTIIWEAK